MRNMKRQKLKNAVCMALIFLAVIFPILGFYAYYRCVMNYFATRTDDTAYSINEPFEYTMFPGSEEWANSTAKEHSMATYVSYKTQINMDTYSLAATFVESPYFISIAQVAAEPVFYRQWHDNFVQTYDVLVARPDAVSSLTRYIENSDDLQLKKNAEELREYVLKQQLYEHFDFLP